MTAAAIALSKIARVPTYEDIPSSNLAIVAGISNEATIAHANRKFMNVCSARHREDASVPSLTATKPLDHLHQIYNHIAEIGKNQDFQVHAAHRYDVAHLTIHDLSFFGEFRTWDANQFSFNDLPWLVEAWREGAAATPSIARMSKCIDGFEILLRARDFSQVSAILRRTRESHMGTMRSATLVLFARTTFLARDKIVEWKKFVEAIAIVLKSRDLNESSILKGLL